MKQTKSFFPLLSLTLLLSLFNTGCDPQDGTNMKPQIIAAHVTGMVDNLVNIIQHKDEKDVVGGNIVGLFGNVLNCIFAATRGGGVSIELTPEEMEALLADLDPDVIEEIRQAMMQQSTRLRRMVDHA